MTAWAAWQAQGTAPRGRFGLSGARLHCLLHFMGLAATLSVAKVILSTIGVALFLAKQGPQQLPLFYVLLALVAIALSVASGGVVDRLPRIALGQIAFLGVLLGAASLRLLIALEVPAVYYAVLASAHIYEIVLDIVFWLVVAAFLDAIENAALLIFLHRTNPGDGWALVATTACLPFPLAASVTLRGESTRTIAPVHGREPPT